MNPASSFFSASFSCSVWVGSTIGSGRGSSFASIVPAASWASIAFSSSDSRPRRRPPQMIARVAKVPSSRAIIHEKCGSNPSHSSRSATAHSNFGGGAGGRGGGSTFTGAVGSGIGGARSPAPARSARAPGG